MEKKGTEKHTEAGKQMPMWTVGSPVGCDSVNCRLNDLYLNIYWKLEMVSCYGSRGKLGSRLGR